MIRRKWSMLGRTFLCPECGAEYTCRFLEQYNCLECMYAQLEVFADQQQLEKRGKALT